MRFVSALLLALLPSIVLAHGPAEWVEKGKYKNRIGELCCGERDCGLYTGGTIEHVDGGYQVNADFTVGEGAAAQVIKIKAFIEEKDATPSPTGDYWLCSWGGKIRCFFAPVPGM